MTRSAAPIVQTASVSHDATQEILSAAMKSTATMEVPISVAVVDAGGALMGFSRSDRAPLLTVDAAVNKAWTAASFGYPTHVWNDALKDPALAPLLHTPRMVAVGGGFAIRHEGLLVGGIGVSGGTYDQDREIAAAALVAAGFSI